MKKENKTQKDDTSNSMKWSLQIQGHKTSLKDSNEEDIDILGRPRSKTENIFMYRPEFVPRPKPKITDVLPTPMLLCDLEDPTPEKEDEIIQLNINEEVSSLYNDIQKELAEIQLTSISSNQSKEYEPKSTNQIKLTDYDNKQDFRYSTQKSQRRSIWRKYIEKEDFNYYHHNELNNQMRYSMKTSNYSLLRILEGAAQESLQRKIHVI